MIEQLIIIFGFVACLGAFIYMIVLAPMKKYKSVPTFEEYKLKHPNHVDNGRVTCKHCGGNNIFLKQVGHIGSKLLNFHLCKSCGASLYRSEV